MKRTIIVAGVILVVNSLVNVISYHNRPKMPHPVTDTIYNGIRPLSYTWVSDNHFTIYIDTIIKTSK